MNRNTVFVLGIVATLAAMSIPSAWAGEAQGQAGTSTTGASTWSAGNPSLVAAIAVHLAKNKGVRAHFTQTQTLAAMRAPLLSSGTLLFSHDHGVIWAIEQPIKATYVMSDAGISEWGENGQRIEGNSSNAVRGARGMAQVSGMMRAMFGGDVSALYAQFDVKAQGSQQQWSMHLTPSQPQLAQAIRGVDMQGGEFLRSLRITLANGDVTQISFTDSALLQDLSPVERTMLGAR